MGTLKCLLIFLAVLLPNMEARSYWMDRREDCAHIDVQYVGRDETVTVYAKSGDTVSSQGSCSINFKSIDTDAKLQIDFVIFSIASSGVHLYVKGEGSSDQRDYGAGASPETYFSTGRAVTLTLHKTDQTASAYNFQLRIKAVRDNVYPPPNDNNPMAVGLVIGIVGAVFGTIFIVACVGVCCFRKYRVRGSSGKSPYLYDPHNNSKYPLEDASSHTSVGYSNDGVKTGSPASRKKLLQHSSDSSDDKSDHNSRPATLNLYRNNNKNFPPASKSREPVNNRNLPVPPPPPIQTNSRSGNDLSDRNGRGQTDNVFKSDNRDTHKVVNERGVDADSRPKNPVLSALNSNAKFRNSMAANDRDAEERAKRISSTSSLDGLGPAPTPPSSQDELNRPPTLPAVPKVKQSPKSKHAVIKRAPRPTSVSSDELVNIEKGRTNAPRDPGTRIIRDDSSSSQSDVVSIKTGGAAKKKIDTTHSLKPDRKGKGRKKQTQSVSSTLDPEPDPRQQRNGFDRDVRPSPKTQRDRILNEEFEKTGSGRYSKRSNRSTPRSSAGKAGKGFSHRRGRSVDQLDSRPTTPTSAYGSFESLPPLVRSSSKTSLYASRTSLYDRRGRRRQGSYSESIASTRDDSSIMRHSRGYDYYSDDDYDGYEKPLSRRDRDRIYKSETDIGKHVKEISTQTLRETATQTGPNESVDVKTKIIVKKKHRSKSTSSSGTQTKRGKNGRKKSRGSDSDVEVKNKADKYNDETDTKKSSKNSKTVDSNSEQKLKKKKRSKSVDELDVKSSKPRPKPRPRKSTGADTILDDKKSASMENLMGLNPKLSVPQSDGFVPQTMYPGQYYPQMGYPMVPPPSYPGQPGFPAQGQPMQNSYPQTGYTSVPPPAPQQPSVNGRKKSNWEMLCELTDSGIQRDDVTETGSVASSVFTNNPHSVQGYGLPPSNQGYYPPPMGYPQQYNYQQQPQNFTNQMGVPVSQQQEKPLNTQSSWAALKEVSASPKQNQVTVKPTNVMPRNESIV